VATILMIFLRVLPKIFLWPHYSGPQELIEPPEPPVPTPLLCLQALFETPLVASSYSLQFTKTVTATNSVNNVHM